MGRYTAPYRELAQYRGIRICCSLYYAWSMGSTITKYLKWFYITCSSSDDKRLIFWQGGITIRLCVWHLPKSFERICVTASEKGSYVSSAFVDWSNEKGTFIINRKQQSTHWEKRSVQMQSISVFGENLLKGDHLLSFDWKKDYQHFRLHPRMWDWFLFQYNGVYYRCIALPLGWTRSPFWSCHLLSPLPRFLRYSLNCQVPQWIDYYLLAPGIGKWPSSATDCYMLCSKLDALIPKLGLLRHPAKGIWGHGMTRLEDLGLVIDTVKFRFFVRNAKLAKLHNKSKHILRTACKARRWVRQNQLRIFTGLAISQLVPIPLARFFTRAIYDDLSVTQARNGCYPQQCVRLSNAGMPDLLARQSMTVRDSRLI